MARSLVWLVVLAGLAACDGPPAEEQEEALKQECDAALDKLQNECAIAIDTATLDAVTCEEGQLCAAGCVENAPCEEIIVTLQGGINTFSACVDVCAGQPIRTEAPACVAAKKKLIEECALGMTGVCTEQDTCFTNCVASYTCAEIAGYTTGEANAFTACMGGC
ncbi:MAG TPA: hypothetical protein VM686_22930 [Polyangiaceae bacterium]|nr:hypothetical protein [Polyangiaceae bacterium]